jgi:hypothetical protein
MTWDISPGHEQEYFEFLVREFIPGVQKMGFKLSDAWATVYGRDRQILVGAVSPSFKDAQRIIHSREWEQLDENLQKYVTNFDQKLVDARSGFQF